MRLPELLQSHNFEKTLLIGFYGGGNYGDELLLEVLQNLFSKNGIKNVIVTHQNPTNFNTYHHDFGFKRINMFDLKKICSALLFSKNIVIGGGGHWGMDANRNILLLGIMLFISRWILGKKVYLIGVGYYGSTNKLGRMSAFLAGKAANHILARDEETYVNFEKMNPQTYIDDDIAYYLSGLNLERYKPELAALEEQIHINEQTLFISLRRFKSDYKNNYLDTVARIIEANKDKPIVVALLEPRMVDPAGYRQLLTWQKQYPNVQIIDFSYNPITLFLLFKKYHNKLVYIGPQFHAIISAHLNKVPFLPVAYDNKVSELLRKIGLRPIIPLAELQPRQVQTFIDKYYTA